MWFPKHSEKVSITTKLRSDICCICWRNSVVISQDTNSSKSHKLWTKLNENNIILFFLVIKRFS